MITNLVFDQNTGNVTVATDLFWPLTNAGNNSNTTAVASGQSVIPGNTGDTYTIQNMYVSCDAGPGAGITRTFAFFKNGDQSLSVALTGAGTGAGVSSGSDTNTGHAVSVSPGDVVSIHSTATGVTTNAGVVRISLELIQGNNQSVVMAVGGANSSNSVASYLPVQGVGVVTTAGTDMQAPVPTPGTFKYARVVLNGVTGGSGKTYNFVLVKNGVDTNINFTIDNASSGQDLVHTVSVSAGDLVYWRVTPSGSPTARQVMISMEFDPTTDGESIQMYASGNTSSATAVRYQSLNAAPAAFSATNTAREGLTQAVTWYNLYVNLNTAPDNGAGTQSYTYALSNNQSTTSTPSVTISEASTSGSDTSTQFASSVGDAVDMKITPSGTPVVTVASWGIVSFIAPAGTTTSTSTSISTSSTSSSTSHSTSSTSSSISTSSTSSSISTSSTSTSTTVSTSSTSSSISISTSSTSSSISTSSTSTSTTVSTSSTSSSISTSSTSSSTSTSFSTSTSTSSSISTSSTSSSTSISTSSTSSSTSTSSTSSSTSTTTSFSTSSTSTSTTVSDTTTSTSTSISTSSTSSSISTSSTSSSTSISTSSTSSSTSTTTSFSTSTSTTASTSSTSSSISTSSTSSSISTSSTSSSTSTSSTSSSTSISTSSTSSSTSTSFSTSTSTSSSTSSTSTSTTVSTSSTSSSTSTSISTSSTSSSTSTTHSTSSTSSSTSHSTSTSTSTSSTSTSMSSTSSSTSTSTTLIDTGFLPRATVYPPGPYVMVEPELNRVKINPRL